MSREMTPYREKVEVIPIAFSLPRGSLSKCPACTASLVEYKVENYTDEHLNNKLIRRSIFDSTAWPKICAAEKRLVIKRKFLFWKVKCQALGLHMHQYCKHCEHRWLILPENETEYAPGK